MGISNGNVTVRKEDGKVWVMLYIRAANGSAIAQMTISEAEQLSRLLDARIIEAKREQFAIWGIEPRKDE